MRIALALLACCTTRSPPVAEPVAAPPSTRKPAAIGCGDEIVVLNMLDQCADLRDGISGYYVLGVASGAHRGESVTVSYDATVSPHIGAWNIAKVTFQPSGAPGLWPNQCTAGGSTLSYGGHIDTLGAQGKIEPFSDEAAARAALAEKCAQ